MKEKRLTPEQRRRLVDAIAEVQKDVKDLAEHVSEIAAKLRQREQRRRARLRRVSFGLLGRE